jgi:uncharacterized membrane protein
MDYKYTSDFFMSITVVFFFIIFVMFIFICMQSHEMGQTSGELKVLKNEFCKEIAKDGK